jgi:hypothetical protein
VTRRSGGRAVIRPYVEPGILSSGDFERPVFEFDRRLRALERAFYRHLVRVVDLDALFALEQRLWVRLDARRRLTDDQVLDLSNAIIERAFERLGRDPIRAMQEGVIGPDGRIAPAPEAPHEHCPFCDDEPEGGEEGPDDDGGGLLT